ncbi:type II toxin-antitoxin system VapC family toxin [Brevundimonas sp.]|uniref:type II toxin-antitoxin system VapC family toxin n=1 Tax=Brevundimonas sp. TaxID=1871086 RepID=UPI003D14FD55
MRLLLDTHTLLWWLTDDSRLGREAHAALKSGENTIYVSAVSAYEVALKHGMGKLPEATRLAREFIEEVEAAGFEPLSLSVREAQVAGRMENAHRDPFDRMLIAQAILRDLTLVSNEKLFDSFGVARLW